MFSKVKALDIPEIKAKIVSGQYHFHEDRPVPDRSLQLWKKRGYNAHKIGIIHVRYEVDGKLANKLKFATCVCAIRIFIYLYNLPIGRFIRWITYFNDMESNLGDIIVRRRDTRRNYNFKSLTVKL